MRDLSKQIEVFNERKEQLEDEYLGRWVIFYDEEFVGDYESFEMAAEHAVEAYGRGPYLIRKVGGVPFHMPASLLYTPTHA